MSRLLTSDAGEKTVTVPRPSSFQDTDDKGNAAAGLASYACTVEEGVTLLAKSESHTTDHTTDMEVFPGSYIAKLSIGAASALGGVVVAVMSHRTGSAVSLPRRG